VLKEHLYSEPAALRVELVFHSAVIDRGYRCGRAALPPFFDLVELARMRKYII
jgi:hypothetical protein